MSCFSAWRVHGPCSLAGSPARVSRHRHRRLFAAGHEGGQSRLVAGLREGLGASGCRRQAPFHRLYRCELRTVRATKRHSSLIRRFTHNWRSTSVFSFTTILFLTHGFRWLKRNRRRNAILTGRTTLSTISPHLCTLLEARQGWPVREWQVERNGSGNAERCHQGYS